MKFTEVWNDEDNSIMRMWPQWKNRNCFISSVEYSICNVYVVLDSNAHNSQYLFMSKIINNIYFCELFVNVSCIYGCA